MARIGGNVRLLINVRLVAAEILSVRNGKHTTLRMVRATSAAGHRILQARWHSK